MARVAVVLAALALAASAATATAAVGCLNGAGQPVDWWIALKAPFGSRYGYLDNVHHSEWMEADNLAATDGNPLADTLQQIYQPDVSYVIYNDQPFGYNGKPKGGPFHAHAKGVLGYEDGQGFWLVHSNPKLPDSPSEQGAQYTGIGDCSVPADKEAEPQCGPGFGQQKYGQSYLCVSMSATTLETVAKALQITGGIIVDSFTTSRKNEFPNLNKLAHTKPPRRAPQKDSVVQAVQSLEGERFLHFAMTPTEEGDDVYLYEQLIEPKLQAGLYVETWYETLDFPTYCINDTKSLKPPKGHAKPDPPFEYDTLKVSKVMISEDLQWDNPTGTEQGDHSKWAVTILPPGPDDNTATASRKLLGGRAVNLTAGSRSDGYPKSVCIGDINRAGHQLQRGGGAVCFIQNDALWGAFSPIVDEFYACGKDKPRKRRKGDDDDDDEDV